MKTCETCGRQMRPLFIHCVCDYCDGIALHTPTPGRERGWITYPRDPREGGEEYVFETRAFAERWVELRNYDPSCIREVELLCPPVWQSSRGNASGLRLADHLYRIFSSEKLAQEDASDHRAIVLSG